MRLAALSVLWSISAILTAQTTFRAGVQEVTVEAVVTDKKGNFQRDLTRENFKLWEDGKEQKITSLSLEGSSAAGHSGRHFIAFVFDSERPGLREEVVQFVERNASPDLYLAVYSRVPGEQMRLKLQQAFTTDAARIQAAIRNMEVSTVGPLVVGRPLPNVFQDRISGVAAELSWVRGRKALVLFSASFYGRREAGQRTEDRFGQPLIGRAWLKVIEDLNSANVALHAFAIGRNAGVPGEDYYHQPKDGREDQGGMTDFLRDLAVGTGGRYTPPGTYDLASYLSKVSKDENQYYLLGFAPPPESADKPCHKIKVKIDRSDLRVDARDSYCSSEPLSTRGLTSAQKALYARMESAGPGDADMQLSWFYAKPGTALVDVAISEHNLVGIAYRQDGSVAARFVDRQFSIGPGKYEVRVAAGKGVAQRTLEIEPWSGQSMMVSGIVLSVEDHPLVDVTSELDATMMEGPRRLASKGRVIVPMPGTQFPAGRDGLFYFEIYQPGKTPPALYIRIFDRDAQLKYQSGSSNVETSGKAMIPVAMELPIAKLPPGEYILDVLVNGLERTAEFSIR
jgi:VWFA-related protein